MRKVWGVTSGQYSDYAVHVLCETEEGAKEIAEKLQRLEGGGYETYRVEDFPLLSSPEEAERVPVLTLSALPASRLAKDRLNEKSVIRHQWSWGVEPCDSYGNGYGIAVEGTDFERVRKVYGERRAEFLAHLNGLT